MDRCPGGWALGQFSDSCARNNKNVKLPEKAEDICPYATFPEVATTYPVSTSKSRGTVGSIRHLDMIVMHEHPTMLVSDANRDSVRRPF